LVWCAGDVTNYQPVSYDIEGSVVKSFLAPAALNKRFNYDKLVALIPLTLFLEDHSENYKLLLKGKSLYDNKRLEVDGRDLTVYDPAVHELLAKGFECYLVPHGGISHPLVLKERDGKIVVNRSSAKKFNYDLNVTFNSVYAALRECMKGYDEVELHIDLTHGSNVLVTVLMLASQVIAEARGLEADASFRLWCAPILGPPEPGLTVKFLDVSRLSNIVRGLVAGTCAWRRLDERLLPINWYKIVGSRLGPKFKEVYGFVKSLLNLAEDLLWTLRSGQAPFAYLLCRQVPNINGIKERLDEMIYESYLRVGGLQEDEPWISIADVIVELTDKLVKDLKAFGDSPIDVTTRALQRLYETQYYDKVIAVAREYAVLLILRRLYCKERERVEIAGDLWSKVDEELKLLAQKKDPAHPQALSAVGLTEDDVKTFESLRQMRNKLMHGGLSKEMNAEVSLRIDPGRILEPESEKDKKPIWKKDVEKEAEKAIKLIEKLRSRETT